MRRIVRLDLTRRLAPVLPRPLTEILIAVAVTSVLVAIRIALTPFVGDVAPFALVVLAMVVSALLAGWRSGLISLLLGEALIWYFVLGPSTGFAFSTATLSALLMVGAAGLLILLALGLYQHEARAAELERARRISFLDHALREMDHRTRNNFQMMVSLLQLQSSRAASEEVRAALAEASERLKALASVYDSLSLSSEGLGTIRLQDQLQQICDRIRQGLVRPGIALETDLEPMLVPRETGACIGIVVNELVTNACKHAFPGREGTIRVTVRNGDGHARIEVADDGCGMPARRPSRGLGARLVEAFVRRIDGRAETFSSPEGTIHSIMVPL